MRNALKFFLVIAVWLPLQNSAIGDGSVPPPEGGVLPEIVLAVPESLEHQKYLGLAGKKTFKIPDIKSEIVIIQIFSMY